MYFNLDGTISYVYKSNTTFEPAATATTLTEKASSSLHSRVNIFFSTGTVTILTADVSRSNYGFLP